MRSIKGELRHKVHEALLDFFSSLPLFLLVLFGGRLWKGEKLWVEGPEKRKVKERGVKGREEKRETVSELERMMRMKRPPRNEEADK